MTDSRTNVWPSKPEAPIVPLAYRPLEAAAALGFSKRKLEQLTKTGEIPFVRVGRCVLYPVEALRQWLADQVISGAADAKQEGDYEQS